MQICDKSRYQRSACKRARLMTSHVNIYFSRRLLQNSPWKKLQQCRISFLHHVGIEIIFLYRDSSLINAWCCRTYANINLLRLRRRELNTSQSAIQHHELNAINHGKEKNISEIGTHFFFSQCLTLGALAGNRDKLNLLYRTKESQENPDSSPLIINVAPGRLLTF